MRWRGAIPFATPVMTRQGHGPRNRGVMQPSSVRGPRVGSELARVWSCCTQTAALALLHPPPCSPRYNNYCPPQLLAWAYRRELVLQELSHYGADLVALQVRALVLRGGGMFCCCMWDGQPVYGSTACSPASCWRGSAFQCWHLTPDSGLNDTNPPPGAPPCPAPQECDEAFYGAELGGWMAAAGMQGSFLPRPVRRRAGGAAGLQGGVVRMQKHQGEDSTADGV
mgnify:CR=1 FL=1